MDSIFAWRRSFVANEVELEKLIDKGQIATQFVDLDGKLAGKMPYNPNGSTFAVEKELYRLVEKFMDEWDIQSVTKKDYSRTFQEMDI